MIPEDKLGYRTLFWRRRRRLLVCFHTANHLVLGLNVHFFKHPQYITELFSYKSKIKEASDFKCPAGGTDL